VDKLPETLREAGLLEGIVDVRYAGRLTVPEFSPLRATPRDVLNLQGIRSFSLRLADRIGFTLDLGRFPLVLGGDCSILLGAALALRRRGRYGLFFIDGHCDFYSPESEPNGEMASIELAAVTGRDPAALADLEGLRPLVREQDVVVLGFRDEQIARSYGSPDVRQTAMHLFDLAEVRRLGPAAAARRGLEALEADGVDGFWITSTC
jgi:arginase